MIVCYGVGPLAVGYLLWEIALSKARIHSLSIVCGSARNAKRAEFGSRKKKCHDVGRPAPDAAALALCFTAEVARTQRRSDGTFTLGGVRFEVPSRFGHLEKLCVRAAAWDLGLVHLVDPKTSVVLCRLYPLDKHRNAAGRRATRIPPLAAVPAAPTGVAPLLQKLIAQYAATGLPPAYLPQAAREDQP